jgi:ATP-dependent DNA ligase
VHAFGANLAVGKLENQHSGQDREALESWMSYIAFDLLYIDGKDALALINSNIASYNDICLLSIKTTVEDLRIPYVSSAGSIAHLPLQIRRAILESVLVTIENRIEIVTHEVVMSLSLPERLSKLEAYYNNISLLGEEGLVVKDLASPYILGTSSRSQGHWVKLKPEYGDSVTIDVAIVGLHYGVGQGFRGRGFSVMLGAVKESESSDRLVPFCTVGTGFSYSDLATIR